MTSFPPIKTMPDEDLGELAYHEAGHAIMVWKHCVRIIEIAITEEYIGHCKHNLYFDLDMDYPGLFDWRQARKKAQILMAGAIAQKRYCPSAVILESDPDEMELNQLTKQLFPDSQTEADRWICELKEEATQIIANSWEAVTSLACELMVARTLPGEAAMRILKESE